MAPVGAFALRDRHEHAPVASNDVSVANAVKTAFLEVKATKEAAAGAGSHADEWTKQHEADFIECCWHGWR